MTPEEKSIIDAVRGPFEAGLNHFDYIALKGRLGDNRERYRILKNQLILAVKVVRPLVAPKCYVWSEEIADAIIEFITNEN